MVECKASSAAEKYMAGTIDLPQHMAQEAIGSGGESTTVILLNGHRIKLPSKYTSLYSSICAAP